MVMLAMVHSVDLEHMAFEMPAQPYHPWNRAFGFTSITECCEFKTLVVHQDVYQL